MFASPYLKTGESWSSTFTAPGVHSSICSLHPKMVASITAGGAARGLAATVTVLALLAYGFRAGRRAG